MGVARRGDPVSRMRARSHASRNGALHAMLRTARGRSHFRFNDRPDQGHDRCYHGVAGSLILLGPKAPNAFCRRYGAVGKSFFISQDLYSPGAATHDKRRQPD